MRELNECLNAANDLLRADNAVSAELIQVLLRRAFELGRNSAKDALIDAVAKFDKS